MKPRNPRHSLESPPNTHGNKRCLDAGCPETIEISENYYCNYYIICNVNEKE